VLAKISSESGKQSAVGSLPRAHFASTCSMTAIRIHTYDSVFTDEAVGDRSSTAHAQSLVDLDAKYADVVELEDRLQYQKTFGQNSSAACWENRVYGEIK
jgi:hypothetical protein